MATVPDTMTAPVVAGVPPLKSREPMVQIGDIVAPAAPTTNEDTGIDVEVLANLAIKLAYTVPRFTTHWATENLCLPQHIVADLLEKLRRENLLEVLGQKSPYNYQFEITGRGRERAKRLLEVSGYVGPAPVSLEQYTESLRWQFEHLPQPAPEEVAEVLSDLVFPEDVVTVAGLAVMSRRGLFLNGPAGNGKTALGYKLHDAVGGEMWVPHCLGIDDQIIRVFDRQCHEPLEADFDYADSRRIDQRWVRVRRPFIVVGGELTVDSFELQHSSDLGFYEAPLHFKANGGTFMLDDFGCQRSKPEDLLNRWIHPLEREVDFLNLETGQQIEVPFSQMLIVSTNLDPDKVMSPAFLRRMGYRMYLGEPTEERYNEIFRRYAADNGLEVPAGLLKHLSKKYAAEGREHRCCEPRDLIERARDICRFQSRPLELSTDVIDLAWRGYFGSGAGETS